VHPAQLQQYRDPPDPQVQLQQYRDPPDPQVQLQLFPALPDRLAQPRQYRVLPARLDLLLQYPDPLDQQVLKAHREYRVFKEIPVPLVPLVPQARQDPQVALTPKFCTTVVAFPQEMLA
jgi:hypothetical protein